jgi:hypothetical protein
VLVNETEFEQLGAQPSAPVMAGLEPCVELGDRDRPTVEKNLTKY